MQDLKIPGYKYLLQHCFSYMLLRQKWGRDYYRL